MKILIAVGLAAVLLAGCSNKGPKGPPPSNTTVGLTAAVTGL